DGQRCRGEFVAAMYEDLRWLGIVSSEGPDIGGRFAPYSQSERRAHYLVAWKALRDRGMIYPCTCSRRDVTMAAGAPHEGDDEPVYPGTCRPGTCRPQEDRSTAPRGRPRAAAPTGPDQPAGVNWRFRVPDGEEITFTDLNLGPQRFIAGHNFGDFLIW